MIHKYKQNMLTISVMFNVIFNAFCFHFYFNISFYLGIRMVIKLILMVYFVCVFTLSIQYSRSHSIQSQFMRTTLCQWTIQIFNQTSVQVWDNCMFRSMHSKLELDFGPKTKSETRTGNCSCSFHLLPIHQWWIPKEPLGWFWTDFPMYFP